MIGPRQITVSRLMVDDRLFFDLVREHVSRGCSVNVVGRHCFSLVQNGRTVRVRDVHGASIGTFIHEDEFIRVGAALIVGEGKQRLFRRGRE